MSDIIEIIIEIDQKRAHFPLNFFFLNHTFPDSNFQTFFFKVSLQYCIYLIENTVKQQYCEMLI